MSFLSAYKAAAAYRSNIAAAKHGQAVKVNPVAERIAKKVKQKKEARAKDKKLNTLLAAAERLDSKVRQMFYSN